MNVSFPKSRAAAGLALLLLAFPFFSCSRAPSEASAGKALKIASMAPSSTSILAGLGLASSIVAIDTWSTLVPGISPSIPRFDMMKPDVELLAETGSNLLLVSTMTQEGTSRDPFKPLSEAGIKVVYIPTSNSLQEIRNDVAHIAKLTGREKEGEAMVSGMDAELKAIRAIVEKIPASKRRTAVFEIAPSPSIYSFGSGVYLNELLEAAGVENVLANEKGWIAVSAETVVASDPDVILTNVAFLPDPVAEIYARSGWSGMKAVKNRQVFYIDNETSSQPTPNVVKALRQIAEAVYPEYFK